MPGYEIYSSDGTLVMRFRRGDFSAVHEQELLEMVHKKSALKTDGTAITKAEFKIKELPNEDYEKSRDQQIESNIVPTFDGKGEDYWAWKEKYLLTQGIPQATIDASMESIGRGKPK